MVTWVTKLVDTLGNQPKKLISHPVHSSSAGYLYITGRIKEILITRGGENIAPVPIEVKMLEALKILSYCMVIGDNQKYLTMFVTLRSEVSSGDVM